MSGARRRRGDDRARDPARRALLAVALEDRRKGRFVGLVDQLGGAQALARHPHVERAVGGEGKAALRVLELVRGQAEVEHDAVEALDAGGGKVSGHVAEATFEHRELVPLGSQPPPARDRGRVAIEAVQTPGAGREDRAAVAAAAEGGIEIDAARTHGERRQHLAQQHRDVTAGLSCGRGGRIKRSQRKTNRARRTPLRLAAGRLPAVAGGAIAAWP